MRSRACSTSTSAAGPAEISIRPQEATPPTADAPAPTAAPLAAPTREFATAAHARACECVCGAGKAGAESCMVVLLSAE
jgi:hypothetical protein